MVVNSIVQFNEHHNWCGCLGIIEEIKKCGEDIRYMVGVPIPNQGTAYVYVMKSANALEPIGMAELVSEE